jgi:hypothetical protein
MDHRVQVSKSQPCPTLISANRHGLFAGVTDIELASDTIGDDWFGLHRLMPSFSKHPAQVLEPIGQLIPIRVGHPNLFSSDDHTGCKVLSCDQVEWFALGVERAI